MSNLSQKQKQQVFQLKQGWPALCLLVCLFASRIMAEGRFGKGWAIATSAGAALIWFVIAPWRFGLLPQETRRGIKLIGAVALCGSIVVALLSFWRYGIH